MAAEWVSSVVRNRSRLRQIVHGRDLKTQLDVAPPSGCDDQVL
jgi:hypothetical protein